MRQARRSHRDKVLGRVVRVVAEALERRQLLTTQLGDTSIAEGRFAGSNSVLVSSTTPWTATSNVSWLTTTATGSGNGLATFSFLSNETQGTRTGQLTIGGQTLTITQAGLTYTPANTVSTLLTTGFGSTLGLSVDDAGMVYGASQGSIVRYNPVTAQRSTVVSGAGAFDVVVDPSGTLGYFVDAFSGRLVRFNPATGTTTTLISSGLSSPEGVAIDPFENVYIAETGANVIRRYSGSGLTTAVTGLNAPRGVAVDFNGIVYIADTGNNAVKRWNPSTNQLTTVVTGLNAPTKVALDRSGNVYIADSNSNTIRRWNSVNNQLTTLVSNGLNRAQAVAVDLEGNVYVGDTLNNALKVVPRAFVSTRNTDVTAAAQSGSLVPVLPATQPLVGGLAPIVDQPWVTLGAAQNGASSFSVSDNLATTQRFATVNVLGVPSFIVQSPPIFVGTLADNLSSSPLSLRQAIASVNARTPVAELIVIPANLYSTPTTGQPDPNTIRLGSELPAIVPGVDVKIRAEMPGTDRVFSVSGENLTRIIQTGPTATLRLENLTLTNGNASTTADGGAIINSGSLTLLNSAITNSRGVKGGAIASSGPVTLIDSVISGNTAGQVGAGIFTLSAPVTATRSTFSTNRVDGSAGTGAQLANGGGGIWAVGSVVTVADSTFSANRTERIIGGGSAVNGGAGIAAIGGSTLNVTGTAFPDNVSLYSGGGILAANSTATIVGSTFDRNNAGFGGGVINVASDVVISGSTFTSNSASSPAIISPIGSAVIMAFAFNATLLIDGSTFELNNQQTITVFGLSSSGSTPNTLTLRNSTVTTSGFTGVVVGGGSTATIVHSSIYGNATDIGSDLFAEGAVTLQNSIVGSTSGNITGLGVNIVQSGVTGPGIINADPKLAPISDNGGTVRTMELLPGSPALNTAAVVPGITTDQRGAPRDATPDVGAFELIPLVVTTAADEDNGTINPATGTGTSLREAVRYAQADPFTRTITFAPSLAGQTITLANGYTGPADATALTVAGNLTIDGQDRQLTLANATGTKRRLFAHAGGTFNLKNIDLTGGDVAGTLFGLGGAILAGGPLKLTNVRFSNHRADAGGAIYLVASATANIVNATFTSNTSTSVGGAIYADGSVSISNATFTGNSSGDGGAIRAAGAVSIVNSTFTNNSASASGGALRLFGSASINASTFNANTVGSAAGNEGGALLSTGNLSVVNSTFADNGRNALALSGGTADLQFVTIAYNRNGGIAITGATATLRNVLAAGNTGFDVAGPLTAMSSNNLLNLSAADARIGPLADNGGPTLTILPLSGSPAINNGVSLNFFDQRGQFRSEPVDIGAVEVQRTFAALTSATFEFETRQAIVFNFNGDATADFSRFDYSLTDLATFKFVPEAPFELRWNATGTQAVLDLINLPDANYRLFTRLDPQNFHILRGDANRDRRVDFNDLLALSRNFNQSGRTYSQGNFDYSSDGLVGFSDLVILARAYGQSLPADFARALGSPPATTSFFSATRATVSFIRDASSPKLHRAEPLNPSRNEPII